MLTLKNYQQTSLDVLVEFLEACRESKPADAFKQALNAQGMKNPPRYARQFGDVPAACLRVPTGGGKTIMASHIVALAGQVVLGSDAPVAVWFTPTDIVRRQTLEALQDLRHPYRRALTHYFGDRVQICDLESLQTISPHETGRSAIIVVTTTQAFNVTDTSKRNVYSFFEELAPHFDGLPEYLTQGLERVTADDLKTQPFLTARDIGRVKYSVANWLSLQNPILVVDEAHNNRTKRFYTTVARINPACVVELSATPVDGSNNVLYRVSAAELRAEQMIKLPIVLSEYPMGWQACLKDAVRTRERLERLAAQEEDYVRPIVLVQAEPKGRDAVPEVVKKYLVEEEQIPEDQIAIVTGSQKELDGINLFDPATKIRYVITVEALKEGWDCSFAYILAGLQNVHSAKDVEQLLGRVLRMPYARNRIVDELNSAYAHIVADSFTEAAMMLKDRMINKMGFDPLEASTVLVPDQEDLDLPEPVQPEPEPGDGSQPGHTPPKPMPKMPDMVVNMKTPPPVQELPAEVREAVTVTATKDGGVRVQLPGDASSEVLQQVENFLMDTATAGEREQVEQQIQEQRVSRRAMRAPEQLGLTFAPIPQLCLQLENYLEVVERETLANLQPWSLLDREVRLDGLHIEDKVQVYEVDVSEETSRLVMSKLTSVQIAIRDLDSGVSQQDLVFWLDSKLRQPDIGQLHMQEYLSKVVMHLMTERDFDLMTLVRARFQLEKTIRAEIERLRKEAMDKAFQAHLPNMETAVGKEREMQYSFHFQPGIYPHRSQYKGSYEFKKHFYGAIDALREKTDSGEYAEEFICAKAIEENDKVKRWVRNIERQPKTSFWLPTSSDYFYPDFVAELEDGRILVVEYKGEPYKTNDDSREKMRVGAQWEKTSGGKCLFLFAVKVDEQGRNVYKQIADKIG